MITTAHPPLVENSDFTPTDTRVEWHENSDLTQCVLIPIINDKCSEKDETFNVSLSTEEEGVEFSVDWTTVFIQDDDRESCIMHICMFHSPRDVEHPCIDLYHTHTISK